MERITTSAGTAVSYDRYFPRPRLVYAVARPGSGRTNASRDHRLRDEALARLEELGRPGSGDGLAVTFFRDALFVPVEELNELRGTELWPPIVAGRFRALRIPVLRQTSAKAPGSSSSPKYWPESSQTSGSRSCPARPTKR